MWKEEGQNEGHWTNDDDMISRFSDDNYDEILRLLRNDLDIPLVLWLDDFHPAMNTREKDTLIQCGFCDILLECMKGRENIRLGKPSSYLAKMFL